MQRLPIRIMMVRVQGRPHGCQFWTVGLRNTTSRVCSSVFPLPWRHFLSVMTVPLSRDRKSTRLNSRHVAISYAVFCFKKQTPGSWPASTAAHTYGDAWSCHLCFLVVVRFLVGPVAVTFLSTDPSNPSGYTLSLHDALPISHGCQFWTVGLRNTTSTVCSSVFPLPCRHFLSVMTVPLS